MATMHHFLACPCLNIRLHLPIRPLSTGDGSEEELAIGGCSTAAELLDRYEHHTDPSRWTITLGIGGATAEHESLVMIQSASHGRQSVHCLNCQRDIYLYTVSKRRSSLAPDSILLPSGLSNRRTLLTLSPSDTVVEVLEDSGVVAGKEITRLLQSSKYSPAFKIVLESAVDLAQSSTLPAFDKKKRDAIAETTATAVQVFERNEEAALEQRVAEYRSEQQRILETRIEQAHKDTSAINLLLLRADDVRERTLQQFMDGKGASPTTTRTRAVSFADEAGAPKEYATANATATRTEAVSHTGGPSHPDDDAAEKDARRTSIDMTVGSITTRAERLSLLSSSISSQLSSLSRAINEKDKLPSEVKASAQQVDQPTSVPDESLANKLEHADGLDSMYSDDSGDELFLLDEEAELDENNVCIMSDQQPAQNSTQGASYALEIRSRGPVSEQTSRPGMHYGVSMMDRYGAIPGAMFPQSLATSWARPRTRNKFTLAGETDDKILGLHRDSRSNGTHQLDRVAEQHPYSDVDDEEARDGLAALRTQLHDVTLMRGSQSPVDASTMDRMLATSLPVNIHRDTAHASWRRSSRGSRAGIFAPLLDARTAANANDIDPADRDAVATASLLNSNEHLMRLAQAHDSNEDEVAVVDDDQEHEDEDDEDSEAFVAPHLLAARSYTDHREELFGSMPKSSTRTRGVAM